MTFAQWVRGFDEDQVHCLRIRDDALLARLGWLRCHVRGPTEGDHGQTPQPGPCDQPTASTSTRRHVRRWLAVHRDLQIGLQRRGPINAQSRAVAGPYGRQNRVEHGPQRSRSKTHTGRPTAIFTLKLERVPLAFQAGHAGSIPVTRSTGNPLHSKDFHAPTASARI